MHQLKIGDTLHNSDQDIIRPLVVNESYHNIIYFLKYERNY